MRHEHGGYGGVRHGRTGAQGNVVAGEALVADADGRAGGVLAEAVAVVLVTGSHSLTFVSHLALVKPESVRALAPAGAARAQGPFGVTLGPL